MIVFRVAGLVSAAEDAGLPEHAGRPQAMSLYLDAENRPIEGYYPVGMLGGRGEKFHRLHDMGITLSETGFTPYAWKDGKPMPTLKLPADGGTWFVNSWAAHSTYRSRETAHYGTLPNQVKPDGTPYGHYMICLFDPTVRRYIFDGDRAVVEAILSSWGDQSDRLLLWGIDNEWEPQLDYGPQAREAFAKWLSGAYGGKVETLNQVWGTKYTRFDQAEPPKPDEFRTRPAAWLDWHRCQEENYTDVIAERVRTLRDADPGKRPAISKNTQCTMEMTAVAKGRTNNWGLLGEKLRPVSGGLIGLDLYGSGDRNCYEVNYAFNCLRPVDRSRGYGVFVAETNNHNGPGWQFAESYWRLPAQGLKGIDYFVLGGVGAKGDYDTFGFMASTGQLKPKLHYVARWANLIHRSERFWTDCVPAPNLPRVAILMSHRDVLLADNPSSRWAYPGNNRLRVYSWLREQGYWVEVIPNEKLLPEFLSSYDALFLVGADHLSAPECEGIKAYVNGGGVLLADMRAGLYDEHHRENHGLDEVLGVKLTGVDYGKDLSPDDVWYMGAKGMVRGDGRITYELAGGRHVHPRPGAGLKDRKLGRAIRQDVDKGHAIWLNTQLGVLRAETEGDRVVSSFLARLLADVGVQAAYGVIGHDPAVMSRLRVEAPQVDGKGNCVIIVTDLSKNSLSALTVEMVLPPGPWRRAWWAPAEHAGLVELMLSPVDRGRYRFSLPAFETAGVVYLLKDHPPILGIDKIDAAVRASDGWTPLLPPGKPFTVRVEMVNPVDRSLASGKLRVIVAPGWKVSPPVIDTPALTGAGWAEFTFEVTPPPPDDDGPLKPDWLYPLVARWGTGGTETAVCTAQVQVALDKQRLPHLLSGNERPKGYPYQIKTGATYTYLAPGKDKKWGDPCNNGNKGHTGNALTDGAGPTWGHLAIYSGVRVVDVVFDLKASYEILRVKLAKAPSPGFPKGFTVLVSEDGKTYKAVATVMAGRERPWKGIWLESDLLGGQGRYVRVQIHMPGSGYVQEVEIWGRKSDVTKKLRVSTQGGP